MRIRKLAIAALIAAVPTAAAFAQSALDQSVPRVSPRESPRTSPTDPSTSSQSGNTRGIPIRGGYPNGHLWPLPPPRGPMWSETQEQLPATRGRSVHRRPHGKDAAQSSMRVTVALYGRQLELNRETLFGLGQLL